MKYIALALLGCVDAIALSPPLSSRQSSFASLCGDPNINVTTEAWDENEVGQWLVSQHIPYPNGAGPIKFLTSQIPQVGTQWVCDTISGCHFDLSPICKSNPPAVLTLASIQNFVNFFKDFNSVIESQSTTLLALAPGFSKDFAPPQAPGSSMDPAAAASLAFAGLGTIISIVATAELGFLGPIIGLLSSLLGTMTSPSQSEAEFDAFADVATSIANMKNYTQSSIDSWVHHTVYGAPTDSSYNVDANQLPQLMAPGTFAIPTSLQSLDAGTQLHKAMIAPLINQFWSTAKIGILKGSATVLGFNACEGDVLFPANQKHCDENGVLYALHSINQSPPTDSPGSYIAVPGLDKLSDYGMSVKDIVLAAEQRQDAFGYLSTAPSYKDLVQVAQSIPSSGPSLANIMFFNLPVCKFDVGITSDRLTGYDSLCNNLHGDNWSDPGWQMCIFQQLMNNECNHNTDILGNAWPWQVTIDDTCYSCNPVAPYLQ